MKKLNKLILFISLGSIFGGLFVVNIFNSLINTEKINVNIGGTVNIHIHSTDHTSPVNVPQASEDVKPAVVPQVSKDVKSVIVPRVSKDTLPVIIPQISEDTRTAETLSKDSRLETYRPELIYQFISRYSGLLTSRENDTPSITVSPDKPSALKPDGKPKISEDTKPVAPQKISEDIKPATPQKISEDVKPVAPQKISQDIPAKTPEKKYAPETITFTGWLKSRNDKDTHTFTLDDPCAVNISFIPSEGDKAYYILTVTGDLGHVITRKMIDSSNSYSGTGNIYLRPGIYTVSIERGYSWSGKPYRITLNTSQPQITEHESNNSPQTTNVIPLNEDVRASSGTSNDTDYFTFTLEKPCTVCPYLKFNAVRNGRKVYDKKLYEFTIDDRDFIFRGDATPSRKIKPFVLDAGTYIMSVSRLDSEELELGLHEYTLRVDAQEIM